MPGLRSDWRAVALSDGHRFCTHCQTEYDPATVVANVVALDPGAPVIDPLPITLPQQCPACGQVMPLGADDIYHCPNERDADHVTYYGGAKLRVVPAPTSDGYGPDELSEQIGTARAMLVGAEVVVHDLAAVRHGRPDRRRRLRMGDVRQRFRGHAVLPDDFSLIEPAAVVPAVDDVTQVALAVTSWQIVAQIVRAGQMTLVGAGEDRTIGIPPNGWLPDDACAIPMVESGAAYAVATLATVCGITDEQLAAVADSFDKAASEAAEGAREWRVQS